MTDPTQSRPSPGPEPADAASTPPGPYPAQPVESLARYLEVNGGRFTDAALADASRRAGYSDQAIEQAMDQVRARETAAPVRKRARQAVIGAYLLTYGALVVGMFASEVTRRSGLAEVGTAILTVSMFVALLASLSWLGSRRPTTAGQLAFPGLLAVPLVLLLVVAGLCVATGMPVPRAYDPGPPEGEFLPEDGELPPVPAES